RVRKGFSGVETPLFEGMLVVGEIEEHGDEEEQDNVDAAAQGADTAILGDDVQDQSIPSPTPPTLPPQPPQDIPSTSQVQSPPSQPQSPPLAQPQGADFLISLLQEALDACAALTRRVEHLEHDKVAQDLDITKLKTRVKKLDDMCLNTHIFDLSIRTKMTKNIPKVLYNEVPTASIEGCHCQKKSEAPARKIALPSKVKKKLSVKVK
nr:hypothetical protein [Tanacetum cinerariifolium]